MFVLVPLVNLLVWPSHIAIFIVFSAPENCQECRISGPAPALIYKSPHLSRCLLDIAKNTGLWLLFFWTVSQSSIWRSIVSPSSTREQACFLLFKPHGDISQLDANPPCVLHLRTSGHNHEPHVPAGPWEIKSFVSEPKASCLLLTSVKQ